MTKLRLVPGLEFLGASKNAGYKITSYLLRTPDDRFIEVTELLYQIVYVFQTEQDPARIARIVSQLQGKKIDAKAIIFLVQTKLLPLGIFIHPEVKIQEQQRNTPHADSILTLRYRMTLLPKSITTHIAKIFSPLFHWPVILGIFIDFVLINVWLFGFHGIDASLQQTIMEPFLFLLIIGLLLFSTLFHEFGHAAGCAFGGAKPGRIGSGLYIIWPAFFTDITDIYRLPRRARLLSDIGGIYFNMIFAVIIAVVYFITKYEPLLLVIVLQNIAILNQLLPFVRLDGYYIISDLVGVPDLFIRMKPILKSVFLFRKTKTTKDLKNWVKWAVTGWVLLTIPAIMALLILAILNAPKIFYTTGVSVAILTGSIIQSYNQNNYLVLSIQILQLIVLALPAVSIGMLLFMIGKRARKIYLRFMETTSSRQQISSAT